MNNKFLIQLVFTITIIVFTFWMYCNSYLGNPGRLYNKVFNERAFVNSSVNTDINSTIVESPKVNNIHLPPYSLWHKKNGEGAFGNGRIHSQRRWTHYLSNSPVQIQIPKNILVIKPEGLYLASAGGSQSHQHCPIRFQFNISNKCTFVMVNMDQLDSVNIFKYDAVISSVNGIERQEQYLWNPSKINKGPSPIHIYYTRESPISPYVPTANLSRNNKILASYWSNSDIPVPYGIWVENTNISNYSLPQNSVYDDKKNYAQGKTKLIAMLISNCNGRNDRIKYALELRKYVDVDIYGRCSPEDKTCDPNCFKILKESYKFYLAFENANCRDYITEKLYRNALMNDVIPIVLGAHPEDYKVVAPHNSYIHVEDFASPKALAEYLVKVHENDKLYNDYFKWKKTGHFVEPTEDFFCRVCGMMIYSDFQPKPLWANNSTYKTEDKCLQDKIWYWTR